MPRVVHFEIQGSDPEALAVFYVELSGWKIPRWGDAPYWLVDTGDAAQPGINGGKAALPKMPIPSVGWLAYVKDPDGNTLGLMQPDPGAR